MTRSTWEGLPAAVRAAIEQRTGRVLEVVVPDAGRNSDFSATLRTAAGRVFCKGIAEAAGPRGRMHRHEADINPWLPPAAAPRLRWRAEAAGWLLLGFDHVPGRHADLTPGSPDLRPVADSVALLERDLAAFGGQAPRLASQWARLAPWRRLARDTPSDLDPWARGHLDLLTRCGQHAIDAADGQHLVHTDLHSLNILLDCGQARIIDWAWSRVGSPAVDVAFLLARLVAAGHTPAEADQWAHAIPAWQHTPARARAQLAVQIWGMWEYLSRTQPRPLWAATVPAARAAARHLLEESGL